ncbi:MAG: PAS domain S-box protein [Caldilineae bacterium]|nr:MAG: PAS domain S-box protein [Caldilineae bacterium]
MQQHVGMQLDALARAVEQSIDGIAVLALDGTILYVNPAWEDMHGYQPGELLGRTIQSVYPDERFAQQAVEAVQRLQEGADRYELEQDHIRRDGSPFQVWLAVTLLRDDDGQASGFILIARDVTAYNRMREDLRAANQRLRQQAADLAARNEDLEAFAYSVAHDLKNPLTSILGYAELLRDDFDRFPPEMRREFLDAIVDRSAKMQQIIRELFLLAQVSHQEIILHPVEMGSVIREALVRVKDVWGSSPPVVQTPDAWPPALGHAPWLEEVWVNLLTNAVKFGGPTVEIRLGATQKESDWVRFWIQDNGPGISLEDQTRLFKPFSQLEGNRKEGHGLGLAIVRRIIEKCGGQVGVESAPGAGSRFWFTLRRA